MIISTIEELRLYLPTHTLTRMDTLDGFLSTSERDFLLPVLGEDLYRECQQKYDAIADKAAWVKTATKTSERGWDQLLLMCQRPIVFNALYRSSGILNVTLSASGINTVGTQNFEPADDKTAERFKVSCGREAHQGIDLLLRFLEDDAARPAGGSPLFADLWKKSRYYYQIGGRLIHTADSFNRYVDIYGSREKFISLVQDLEYCEDTMIRPEVGDEFADRLIERMNAGELNAVEKRAVERLQKALALCVETRNKMFSRVESKDEATLCLRLAIGYIASHREAFEGYAELSPLFAPAPVVDPTTAESKWENNRKGSAIFVTKPLL